MAQQQRRRSGGTGAAAGTGSRGRPRAATDRPRAGGDLAVERARVRDVVAPLLDAAGYDLEELAVSRVGRRHLVRVVVDGDDGVSLETIADLSREISAALDAAESASGEFMAHEYQLEVSSPGVDRPLTEPRHWRRNRGRLVSVSIGERTVTGRVTDARADEVVLDVDGTAEAVPYDRLGPGRVQIEFSRMDAMSDDDLDDLGEPGDEEVDEA